MYQIYHNPRCRISRKVLEELLKTDPAAEIIDYMKSVPSAEEIKNLLLRLHLKPLDIIRKEEKIYKAEFKGKNFTEEEWVRILRENPVLIERPIVSRRNKAIICRSPERLNEILKQ